MKVPILSQSAVITRAALVALGLISTAGTALASSHREAPFVTKNPKVDATDFYLFRSYESGRAGYVTLIANYIPMENQYGGPNFFTMDPDALYEIHVDNDGDAKEDLTFQFRFQNALNGAKGLTLDIGPSGSTKQVPVPFMNLGPITASDETTLNVHESYTLTLVTGDRRTGTAHDIHRAGDNATRFEKPVDYIGAKSLGDPAMYEAYARARIHDIKLPGCETNGRVFVGQRAESFAVNLGTVFDLVNAPLTTITDPSLRGAVPNPIGDTNITTLALELPIACVVTDSQHTLGAWTTASVRQARVINPDPSYAVPTREGGAWAQVSRLGHPLVNEVVIGLSDKDKFNSSEPKDDGQFADYVTHPTLAKVIEILFGAANAPAPSVYPRTDLVSVFLTGVAGVNANGSTAEYLRLNTDVAPTAKAGQVNLGAAACFPNRNLTPVLDAPSCDPAGFPNGRRPGDDITDIELRVMMGYLLSAADAPAGAAPLHDAVLQDASQFDEVFPYLKTPNPGS
ncbi:MAG TPA: DUF4331 domain-containing protein [Polyangiaceae bacterium]|jgi:hypothetical protein|nr:DUF4331 domain-containing protein [Polyangiaceae bacterium]